ncbi:uncharacterized protein RB166_020361 [Leptodactylus fuscus]
MPSNNSSSGSAVYTVGDRVNGEVGQSLYLETSYTIRPSISFYAIRWRIEDRAIIHYRVNNCSIDPQGSPTWTTGDLTIYPKYTGRLQFYPLNASLLLHNLQVNDSGNYSLILSVDNKRFTRTIRVDVHQNLLIIKATHDSVVFSVRMALCFLPIAALLYIILRWHCSCTSV